MNEMRKTCDGAVWTLVLGIVSFLGFGPFTAVPAVICGHLSRKKIRNSGGSLTGEGMALAGLILGYIILAITVFVLGILGLVALKLSSVR